MATEPKVENRKRGYSLYSLKMVEEKLGIPIKRQRALIRSGKFDKHVHKWEKPKGGEWSTHYYLYRDIRWIKENFPEECTRIIMTMAEFSRKYDIKENTLRSWITKGKIPDRRDSNGDIYLLDEDILAIKEFKDIEVTDDETEKLIEKLKKRDLSNPTNLAALFDIAYSKRNYELNKEIRGYAVKYSKELKKKKSQKDADKIAEFLKIYKKTLLFAAPVDFDSYMIYLEYDREPDKRFYMPRRLQIKPLVDALQDLADDKLDMLSISMPPGTGKSTLGIYFMTWMMGKFPDKCNLMSAHSGDLTRSFYDGINAILSDDVDYKWKEIFPGVNIVAQNSKAGTIDLDRPKRFQTVTCRAIGATLTGATRCEGILYADDLVSGIEEAMSKERLDKLWMSYTNDLKSRKKLGCKEIHVATRWSVYDVIGRLEEEYGSDERCKFIVVPATDENGKSNFNYQYGVGFDEKYFEDMKKNLDEASFNALFMGQPIEREGQLYPAAELRRFFELPTTDPDAVISVCDTKTSGTDYMFSPIDFVYGDDHYIIDCICENGPQEVGEAKVIALYKKYRTQMAEFESNSAGGEIAKRIQSNVKDFCRITSRYTTSNKETKIIVNSPWVKDHCLFLDASKYSSKSDYNKMMKLLTGYTTAGKNKHDDVPDGMAMLSQFAQRGMGAKASVFTRFF